VAGGTADKGAVIVSASLEFSNILFVLSRSEEKLKHYTRNS
jgi:hypothetical protein